ncbi:MAG: 4Fe-4S dicluster domain-containing protein [Bacteroidales bacterium]
MATDIRFVESLKACINCGTCTAICPAAEFYNYDPRVIATTVQSQDDDKIRELMSGDAIWYCGECMSCKTRCPRGNAPGLLIIALRSALSGFGLFHRIRERAPTTCLKACHWRPDFGYRLLRSSRCCGS